MRNSKFFKVDKDVLVQWLYDDDNFLIEDYKIVVDTLHNTRQFAQNGKTGSQVSVTNNSSEQQLFSLNDTSKKWGVINTDPASNKYLFLQYVNFPGNVPFKYDIVRVHFPVNYTFSDKLGFVLDLSLVNRQQNRSFTLSNYYYDKTDLTRSGELQFGKPFSFQEKSWGKYIEIMVPSPNALINDYVVGDFQQIKPRPGSIQANLVGDELDMLSLENPVNIAFAFLTKIEKVGTQVAYFATDPFKTTLSVKPEYETLAVEIRHAPQGDYFEIYGVYNATLSEFNAFIKKSALEGRKYYVSYEITTYEKNLTTRQETQVIEDNFDKPVEHRPIIKFSTTTATLSVNMRLTNINDGSSIERSTSYSMLQDEVSKYSNFLTKINTVGVSKPKIYNSKPDQINLTINPASNARVEKVVVNYPLMYERYNILAKNKSEQVNDTVWYGMGQSEIMLYPYDNVITLAIGKGTNATGIVNYKIPTACTVYLSFSSDSEEVLVPLFTDNNITDLGNGVVSFKVPQAQNAALGKMYAAGFCQYYVNLKTASGEVTVLYAGKFTFYNK